LRHAVLVSSFVITTYHAAMAARRNCITPLLADASLAKIVLAIRRAP